jgi:hypothetical protein
MLAASESAQRDEPASARTLGFLRLHFIRLTLRVRQVDDMARFRIAAAGAKGLPEPERLMIEGALAVRRGDATAGIAAFRRITELVPGYARGHDVLAAPPFARATPMRPSPPSTSTSAFFRRSRGNLRTRRHAGA